MGNRDVNMCNVKEESLRGRFVGQYQCDGVGARRATWMGDPGTCRARSPRGMQARAKWESAWWGCHVSLVHPGTPLLTHSLDYIMFLWIRILEAFACGMVHVREGKEAVGRTESWPFVHQSSIIVGLHIGRITYWMDCGLDRLHIELTGRAAAALPPGAPRLQTQTPHPIIDGLHIGRIADWMDCRSSLPRVRPRTRTPCDFGPTVWGR